MKSLAVAGFMVGLIFFWSLYAFEPSIQATARAEAEAANFAVYRNVVNAYAKQHQEVGSVANTLLNLPGGLVIGPWRNRILWEGNELRCYVYGAASPEATSAIMRVFRDSALVGWNNRGSMVRSGAALKLPNFVADRNVVSVITLQRRS